MWERCLLEVQVIQSVRLICSLIVIFDQYIPNVSNPQLSGDRRTVTNPLS